MEEETQYWSVDELESLTETVQEAEVEYQGKSIRVAWCELTESEEPKSLSIDETLSEKERNEERERERARANHFVFCCCWGGGRKEERRVE